MKKSRIIYALILIGIFTAIIYLPNYYNYFVYGKMNNSERNKFNVVEITDKLYCTYNSKNLRFSATKNPKDLSKLMDSVGYKGHIDKFIFFDDVHYEEDIFIEVKHEGTYIYRSYYYYKDNSKKCTLDKPNNNEGEEIIICGIIDSIFS